MLPGSVHERRGQTAASKIGMGLDRLVARQPGAVAEHPESGAQLTVDERAEPRPGAGLGEAVRFADLAFDERPLRHAVLLVERKPQRQDLLPVVVGGQDSQLRGRSRAPRRPQAGGSEHRADVGAEPGRAVTPGHRVVP